MIGGGEGVPLRRRSRLGAIAVTAMAFAVLVVPTAACEGGDGGSDSEQLFSRSAEVLRRLVPEASEFNGRFLRVADDAPEDVDLTIATLLDSAPRVHVLSDSDAVDGAEELEAYEGAKIYLQKDTYWAELTLGDQTLYAGTPSEDGVREYVDFFISREPELSNQRFWDAFGYAEERVGQELDETPSLVVVQFGGELVDGTGGLRLEARQGDRQLYVGVLYANDDDGELSAEAVEQFQTTFVVPETAEEQPENADWDFAHTAWFDDSGAAQAEG
jgi:hypothetical protein